MDTKKFLVGTLVGGIAYFILGYLIYGMALTSFFKQHSIAPQGSMKEMADIVWWALILGNLFVGALLTYIFLKLGNVLSFGSGASIGAAIGLFMGAGIDLVQYATQNSSDLTGVIVDVVISIAMTAITGGIIGVALGMGKKKA